MSNELFIEISGSSQKAISALDKIIAKLSEFQNKLLSATSKINQFTNSLKNISFSSNFKQLSNDINAVSLSLSKNNGTSKLSKAIRKVAEDAKFAEEAQKSLNNAVSRAVNNNNLNTSSSATGPIRPPVQLGNYQSYNNNPQAEIAALERTANPVFDDTKIKEAIAEINEFINNLTPNIENMSTTAQNRFDSMAEKLRGVNTELEQQKQLLNNLNADFTTLSKGFGVDIADTNGFAEKIKAAAIRIEELTLQSENLKNSMQKLAVPTQTAGKTIEKTSNSANTASKEFSSFDRVIRNLKTYLVVRAINEVSKAFSGALQNCINFTENMNLFNVSLGENAETAGIFVDKMSRIFSMDSSNLVKTMGTFYQISHSMGVTSKNAYILSENFTKLANDLSSFYNIPVNDAVVKLQAGLVGETEPLRRLGVIVTENALKQTAANLGIQKSVESMSEAEKMHLRYITILDQTKNLQGDFAKTIENPAQSLKILSEQMSQLGRSIGSVFMPVLGAVLPYLIAFSRAITTVISSLAALLGYKAPAYKNMSNGFSDATNEASKLGDSVGRASAKVKEFKKLIMSFDELHILTDPKDPTGGSGGAGAEIGDFAVPDLTGYDNLMDSITSKTDEIYRNIMTFFENVGKLLESTITAFSRLKVELDRLGGFAWQGLLDFYNYFLVPVGNWVFGEGLPQFIDALTNGLSTVAWNKINDSLKNLWNALTPFAIAVGEGLLWFWESVLVPLGAWTLNTAVPVFLDLLAGAVSFLTPIVNSCKDALSWLWDVFLKPISLWSGGLICSVLGELADILSEIGNWMSEHQEIVNNFVIIVGSFALAWSTVTIALNAWNIAVGIWNAIGLIATTVTAGFGAAVAFLTSPITLVILAIGAIIAIVVLLIKYWDDIKNAAKWCWDGIVAVWSTVAGWFEKNIIKPIKNFFSGLWDGIKNIFNPVATWFGDIFKKAYTAVTGAFSSIKSFFSDIWNNIKSTFTSIGSAVGNAIGGAFKAVVNSIINFAQNTINGFIRAINTAIGVINLIPGVNVNKINLLSIPKLAKGGLATKSVLANIGEGQDQEAVLPLNDAVFKKISEGINSQNANEKQEIISEESLYRAFVRALQDAPEKSATFIANLNSKVIAREVLKEQRNENRRFSPVLAY